MRRVPVQSLVPGMVLARPVIGKWGEKYLATGITLSRRYIEKLGELGFHAVYIVDELLDGVEIEDVISEQTRQEAITQVRSILEDASSPTAKLVNVPGSLTQLLNNMVSQLLNNPLAVVNLTDIRAEDAYLFHHSVNVCVLSVMTGINRGLKKGHLLDLGLGALLHDVGKVRVETEVLYKPGALTPVEFDRVKRHCEYGRDMLREHQVAGMVAFSHHERYDGGGYPRGLTGEQIHHYAQIVGIADIYDAVTADRCYRKAVIPHKALNLIMDLKGSGFERALVDSFTSCVAAYPTGTLVEVASGEIGVVVNTPRSAPFSPNVRILMDAARGKLTPYHLATAEAGIPVVRVLEDAEASLVREALESNRQSQQQ